MSCSASSNKLEEREAGSPRCGMVVFIFTAELKAGCLDSRFQVHPFCEVVTAILIRVNFWPDTVWKRISVLDKNKIKS